MSGNEKDLATRKILISLERNMQINIYTMVKALQKKKCMGNRPSGNEIIMFGGKKKS